MERADTSRQIPLIRTILSAILLVLSKIKDMNRPDDFNYSGVGNYNRSAMSKKRLSITCYSTGLVAFGMLNAILFLFVVANSDFCGSVFKSQPGK